MSKDSDVPRQLSLSLGEGFDPKVTNGSPDTAPSEASKDSRSVVANNSSLVPFNGKVILDSFVVRRNVELSKEKNSLYKSILESIRHIA